MKNNLFYIIAAAVVCKGNKLAGDSCWKMSNKFCNIMEISENCFGYNKYFLSRFFVCCFSVFI